MKDAFNPATRQDPSNGRSVPLARQLLLVVGLMPLLAGCDAEEAIETDVAAAAPVGCVASMQWITNPDPPGEIATSETFCDFYQFVWQWFLDLTQPVATGSDQRRWEELPIWQHGQGDQCANPLLGSTGTPGSLFVRTVKSDGSPFEPEIPDRRGQAGGGWALFDQNGNVVFYNVRYNQIECDATSSGFLPGTMEIKTSWRQIDPAEQSRYYAIEAIVEGVSSDPILLGLVGFHLVRNTQRHPEFIWATFEHLGNAPDSANPQPAPSAGWSFTSAECAQCLPNGCPGCLFNTPDTSAKGLTGPATEVTRVHRDGTGHNFSSNPNNNALNVAAIDTLNAQLVGPGGYLHSLPENDPMAVWKNYFLVGAVWTTGGLVSDSLNQRGSLQIANTTMETFHQNLNCFSCHGYNPASPLSVSHIYESLR